MFLTMQRPLIAAPILPSSPALLPQPGEGGASCLVQSDFFFDARKKVIRANRDLCRNPDHAPARRAQLLVSRDIRNLHILKIVNAAINLDHQTF